MVKAREYLVKKHLAKPGRGKFSALAREALDKAVDSGVEFDDYPHKPASLKAAQNKTEKKAVPSGRDEFVTPEMTWPEHSAFFKDDGQKITMKSACNNCGVSLYWCECSRPSVYGRLVTIKYDKTR